MRYETFTDEEIKKLEFAGFEIDANDRAVNQKFNDLEINKFNDMLYAHMKESDDCEIEMNGRIYQLSGWWWLPFDLDHFIEDLDILDPDDFYPEEYELV